MDSRVVVVPGRRGNLPCNILDGIMIPEAINIKPPASRALGIIYRNNVSVHSICVAYWTSAVCDSCSWVHTPGPRRITGSTTESPLPCSSGHKDRRPNSAASECHQEGCSSCSRFVIFLVSGVCPVKLRAQQMGTRYGRAFYKTGFRNCSRAALIRWIYSQTGRNNSAYSAH